MQTLHYKTSVTSRLGEIFISVDSYIKKSFKKNLIY